MEDKIIKIKGHEYKMSFPTVGQYYEIETQKQFLGRGYYNTLLGNRTQAAADALDMIDIEATLTVMLPDLLADMKVTSFKQLGIKDYVEVRDIYNKEVLPFIKEVEKIMNPNR